MKPMLETSLVFVPKAADLLAANLCGQILEGRLQEGQ